MKTIRFDVGSIGKVERTPQGGIAAPAFLTRSGIFIYHDSQGREIREYRPPSEVFNEDSLRSLDDAPVTDGHPPEAVTSENFRQYARGHVQRGSVEKQDSRIGAKLTIQDAELISKIERGDAQEISCGYAVEIDPTPGTTPEGERYDRIQKTITYNHVAIVARGRAGASVRLRLDSEGNQIPDLTTKENQTMITIRIDGQEWPLGTDEEKRAAAAAMARYEQKLSARTDEQSKIQSDLEKQTARADAAELRIKDLEKQTAPESIEARVREVLSLRADVAPILGTDYVFDGKTDQEIRTDAVKVVFPETDLTGKSADYVRAMYDAALTAHKSRKDSDPEGVNQARQDARSAQKPSETTPKEDSKSKLRQDNAQAWTQPLAISKG